MLDLLGCARSCALLLTRYEWQSQCRESAVADTRINHANVSQEPCLPAEMALTDVSDNVYSNCSIVLEN
jgi:hypothetical protein